MPSQKFRITINNFLGGFCPLYWKSDYPSYGNKNMASRMKDIDLTDPSAIKQGPNVASLSGSFTDLIRSIMQTAYAPDETYAIGGAKLYNLSSSGIIGTPITLGGTDPVGEDVKHYHGSVYYTYNHSTAGEMGKDDDVDFLSTVPSVGKFSLQKGVPHPLEVGGDDILYVGNGHLVSTYDVTNDLATESAIDLPDDCVVIDIKYYLQKLYITVNRPNLSGENRTYQSIYIWDTVSESWDNEIPRLGKTGGMIKKDGLLFIFYEDITSPGSGRLGYVDGSAIKRVAQFDGSLPNYYQITEREGYISWVSDNLIYCWGAGSGNLPARLFQFMRGKYDTVGGIAAPFGKLLVASTDGTNYDLSKESNYQTDSYWKSMLFFISQGVRKGVITDVYIDFDKLVSGASFTFKLVDDTGTTIYSKTISYSTDGAITKKILRMVKRAENISVELDWSGGISTAPVGIKSIIIDYHLSD